MPKPAFDFTAYFIFKLFFIDNDTAHKNIDSFCIDQSFEFNIIKKSFE